MKWVKKSMVSVVHELEYLMIVSDDPVVLRY